MTKIRTIEELQQVLDTEMIWRKRELTLVKSLITEKSSSSEAINFHIRSGIALLYAHWEGFIKAAGAAYLTYIASQRLTYLDLANNFVAVAARKLLNDVKDSNKIVAYTKVVERFTSGLHERCNLPTEIETRSNLSTEVLKDIIYTLGFDYGEYEINAKLIDETLLKTRNSIAHGQYLTIDIDEFIGLHKDIIGLMELFSNQISNAASMRAYKRVTDV
jgi:hypothetical protein